MQDDKEKILHLMSQAEMLISETRKIVQRDYWDLGNSVMDMREKRMRNK